MIGITIFSQHDVAVVPSNVSSTIITSHATGRLSAHNCCLL